MGTTVLMRAHMHRLTILLLTHVRRTRSPCISRVEQRPCDRAYYLIEPSLHAAHSALHLISGPAWCGRPRGLWPEGGGGSIPPWAPTLGCRDPLPGAKPRAREDSPVFSGSSLSSITSTIFTLVTDTHNFSYQTGTEKSYLGEPAL